MEEISCGSKKKKLQGKNQKVSKKQGSKHEELAFTIRNNVVY